ncbi:MAG: YbjQ family protein [Coleofasciculaceae cyanobacterium SM2_3_26]|nr:YbjQ family protein [Coleofasciculaceae cyanobacterium SM2_3_26]
MLVTTTNTIEGRPVRDYLGVVTGEAVIGANVFRDLFAGIRDVIGGRTGSYEQVFQRGQQEAIAELAQRAEQLGANAVVGIEVDTGTISVDDRGTLLLITAVGTAVKLKG